MSRRLLSPQAMLCTGKLIVAFVGWPGSSVRVSDRHKDASLYPTGYKTFMFFIALLHVVSEQLGGGEGSQVSWKLPETFAGLKNCGGSQSDPEPHRLAMS